MDRLGDVQIRTLSGRYELFHQGRACGEERWRIEPSSDGYVITGDQELVAPHPFPNRQQYRAEVERGGRLMGLEIRWDVGTRALHATHRASNGMWRVRIEYGGETKEQEGDYPSGCEVEYGTHLLNMIILARRDFQTGGEHEFPVLRIGPPWMAVTPHRMLYRCVETGTFASPLGVVAAKRYVVSIPPAPETEGYSFWADEDGFVLESYEGHDPARPWMRLVEMRRPDS
jgi:hypothetical protein